MGLFDDLVQGISREISRVQAKSAEMLQTYSLSNQIRTLEGKVTATFIEIGRLVFDKYQRNLEVSDDLLKEKTDEIVKCEQEIASLKAELEAIKAQYSPDTPASQRADARAGYTPTPGFECPHCHAPANVDKAFCPLCGGSLKEAAEKAGSGNGDSSS
jgi:hypothetical protein